MREAGVGKLAEGIPLGKSGNVSLGKSGIVTCPAITVGSLRQPYSAN